MPTKDNKNLSHMLYPYMFMLKEGPEFKKDFLDYSLLILHTTSETIRSPSSKKIDVKEKSNPKK
ncbi:MAG: hypothetical protein H0U49_01315 [Parachlamydiaceae bacterium]|nr:hypothetical protein [Parachlamydiaceae bacterium]